jgi:chemotaxis signal transduction protein
MKEGGRDWTAVRRILEAAERTLSMGAEATHEEIDRIYRKRAEELARPVAQSEEVRTESILVIRAGNIRLGIPLTYVAEVVPHPKIATVPGAPSEIAGLVQVRGEVRPVWNLTALLGLNGQEAVAPPPDVQIVLLHHAAQEIGVVAEAIEDTAAYDPEKLQPSPRNLPYTRMTDDYVTVLEVESLFARFQGSITL